MCKLFQLLNMINTDFKSINEIKNRFPDEQSCLVHLEKLRWNGNVISPFDLTSKVYNCSKNKYRCRNTGKYFNVKTNSLFYNSRIELQKWFIAIWLVTAQDKPISSISLSNELKLTQKTAWFMLKNIKNHFNIPLEEKKLAVKTKSKIKKTDNKKPIDKNPKEIEVIVESDKLQMTEWLKLLKK